MGASGGDNRLPSSHDWLSNHGCLVRQENIVNTTVKYATPWLAAAAIGAAIAVAPVASAATHPAPVTQAVTPSPNADTGIDPATPYGTDPESPAIFGYHKWLGDDVDVPF